MAFDYQKLQISIDADSRKAMSSINKFTNSLEKLANIDLSRIQTQFSNLTSTISVLAKESSSFQILAKGLNSVKNALNKMTDLNFIDLQASFKGLEISITPFLNKLRQNEDILRNFANALDMGKIMKQYDVYVAKLNKIIAQQQKINTQIDLQKEKQALINARVETQHLRNIKLQQDIEKNNILLDKTKRKNDDIVATLQKMSNHYGVIKKIISGTAKIGYSFYMLQRISNLVGTIIKNASDFDEIFNKFAVAMRGSWEDINGQVIETYDVAIEFVNELSKATGISRKLLMDYQSTFKNMLASINGLGEQTQYELSEALTRMAIDYASLFNVEIETAMEQFQSVLAGRKVSIRTTSGIDVTDNTLYEYYKQIYAEMGQEAPKTVRQLTQLEKRLLSIYVIQEQMNNMGVEGDFSRTINQVANQLRIMKEQISEVATAIGNLFIDRIKTALYYINGFLMALRTLIGTTDNLEKPENTTGGIIEIEEDANGATEAVESLTSALLGLDEINVLSGTSSSGSLGGIDSNILNAINTDYSAGMEETKNKAVEIANEMLDWLGYTDGTYTNLNRIKAVITAIGSVIAAIGFITLLTTIISRLVTIISSLSNVFSMVSMVGSGFTALSAPILAIVAIITTLVALFVDLYNSNEEFRSSIDNLIGTLVDTLSPIVNDIVNTIGMMISDFVEIFKPVWDSLKESFLKIYYTLEPFLSWLISEVLPFVVEALGNGITLALNVILKLAELIITAFTDLFSIVSNIISLGKPIFDIFGYIFQLLTGQITWDEFVVGMYNAISEMLNVFKAIGESIGTFFDNIWENIKNGFKSIVNFFIRLLNKIIDGINSIGFDMPDWLGGAHVGFSLGHIPELASGGVISTPTTVTVGEYAGARSNPEIIAPQSIMYDTMVSALSSTMKPLVQAIINGDNKVINAVNNLADRPIELNGRKVSESIFGDIQNVARRKGIKIG